MKDATKTLVVISSQDAPDYGTANVRFFKCVKVALRLR